MGVKLYTLQGLPLPQKKQLNVCKTWQPVFNAESVTVLNIKTKVKTKQFIFFLNCRVLFYRPIAIVYGKTKSEFGKRRTGKFLIKAYKIPVWSINRSDVTCTCKYLGRFHHNLSIPFCIINPFPSINFYRFFLKIISIEQRTTVCTFVK